AVGDSDQRHEAIRKPSHIVTINFENLEWLIDNYGLTWPFDMVVVDESTKLRGLRVSIGTSKTGKKFLRGAGKVDEDGKAKKKKGSGASRARALARVAHTKVDRWVNLTGTFVLSGLEAAWGQTW